MDMKKIYRQAAVEIVWLGASFGLALLLSYFLLGGDLSAGTVDLHFSDTYFVIAASHVLTLAFFTVTFTVYLIRQLFNSFRPVIANWILLAVGAIAVILLLFLAGLLLF